LKKQDGIVDKPSKDPKTIVGNFYDGLKNYKTKKSLKDLALEGMTVEEFWQHGNKAACSKTCPSKNSVDHVEIARVVLSCMCLWVKFC
jgi:hypothetical protein